MIKSETFKSPKCIIGLGNPGKQFENNRHNIGFQIVDYLADLYNGRWKKIDKAEISEININDSPVILLKPQTFMNNSGDVVPLLSKKGVKPDDVLVVHDELELPFGKINLKIGGSARGHNGLRSLLTRWPENFARLRFGIGRPQQKEAVSDYVLSDFDEGISLLKSKIDQAIIKIQNLYKND